MNKTILAIGVIALFIGVGIQPAISYEITTPTISDNEEDCFECQSDDRLICNLLNKTFWRLMDLVYSLNNILDTLPEDSILFDVISLYAYIIAMGIVPYIATMIEKLNCW